MLVTLFLSSTNARDKTAWTWSSQVEKHHPPTSCLRGAANQRQVPWKGEELYSLLVSDRGWAEEPWAQYKISKGSFEMWATLSYSVRVQEEKCGAGKSDRPAWTKLEWKGILVLDQASSRSGSDYGSSHFHSYICQFQVASTWSRCNWRWFLNYSVAFSLPNTDSKLWQISCYPTTTTTWTTESLQTYLLNEALSLIFLSLKQNLVYL